MWNCGLQKDKRCKKSMGTVDIDAKSIMYKFPSDTPKAQWFITAYIECEVPGTEDTIVCAIDTTGDIAGGIKELSAEATKVKTSDVIYYLTQVTDSRSPGLYAAVIILSICSVSLLGGFFIFEHLAQKNK